MQQRLRKTWMLQENPKLPRAQDEATQSLKIGSGRFNRASSPEVNVPIGTGAIALLNRDPAYPLSGWSPSSVDISPRFPNAGGHQATPN
jgi:hypothetical protein